MGHTSWHPNPRLMRSELANAGSGFLIGGMLMLAVIVFIVLKPTWPATFHYAIEVSPGLFAGGVLGLSLVLFVPGNPARAGYRFANLPKRYSHHEQQMMTRVTRLRRVLLIILVNAPFLVTALYFLSLLPSRWPPVLTTFGDQLFIALLAWVHVASMAWAAKYLQVLLAMRSTGRDRG